MTEKTRNSLPQYTDQTQKHSKIAATLSTCLQSIKIHMITKH
jgi:hypothetical protein